MLVMGTLVSMKKPYRRPRGWPTTAGRGNAPKNFNYRINYN